MLISQRQACLTKIVICNSLKQPLTILVPGFQLSFPLLIVLLRNLGGGNFWKLKSETVIVWWKWEQRQQNMGNVSTYINSKSPLLSFSSSANATHRGCEGCDPCQVHLEFFATKKWLLMLALNYNNPQILYTHTRKCTWINTHIFTCINIHTNIHEYTHIYTHV